MNLKESNLGQYNTSVSISSGLSLSVKNIIKELIRNDIQQGDGFTEFSEVK